MPIANNDPYFGSLSPPDQDPRMVAQNQQAGGAKPQAGPLDDILMRMITQNLGQAPPPDRPLNNWEIFAGMMHPELFNVLQARRKDTPAMEQYQATQKIMPGLLQAYSSEQSRLGVNDRFQQTQQRLQEQNDFRQRMAANFKPETRQEFDPQTQTNRYHTIYRDPMRNNQPVYDEWSDYAPIHYGLAYDQNNQAVQYPTSPVPQGAPTAPSAPPTGGASGVIPGGGGSSIGPTPANQAPAGTAGKSTNDIRHLGFGKAPNQAQLNILGMQGQLKNARLGLETLKNSWTAAQQFDLGTRTAGAMGQAVAGKFPSVRGGVEEYTQAGSKAIIHENTRNALAATLVRPLLGTTRAQGLSDRLLEVIPHFTDNKEVVDAFYSQMNTWLDNMQSAMSGSSPEEIQQKYGDALDSFIAQLGAQSSAPGPSQAAQQAVSDWKAKRGLTVKP